MGFSFIVTSIVLVICSSYRIHISLRAHVRGGGVDAASLAPSVKAMGKELREWYKEHDMSVEVSELLAEVLRPALLTAYGEAHRSAFAALSQSRKKKQEVFESALAQVNSHRLLTSLLASLLTESLQLLMWLLTSRRWADRSRTTSRCS